MPPHIPGVLPRVLQMHRATAMGAGSVSAALSSAFAKTLREYSLAASTAVSGEYPTVVETRGGTALAQTDADRKPAAATAANGLPVMTFDGSDVLLQALETGNNGTSKWWMLMWVKPADFGASQQLYACMTSSGASANRMRITLSNTTGTVGFDAFVSGFNGRNYLTAGALTAAGWNPVYLQFDNTRTSEADLDGSTSDAKMRIAFGNTFQALTASNQGSGGVPSALLAATGTACLLAATYSDTPGSPLRNGGQLGPRLRFGSEPLTAAELAALLAHDAPT